MKANASKSGAQRVVSEYFPMAIAAGLAVFILWSFIVSPYVGSRSSTNIDEDPVDDVAAAATRRPLSSPSPANPSGMTHKTDFMPERTDMDWLLNKTLAVDPLLVNSSFSLGDKISNWDEQRAEHSPDSKRVFLVSGAQPQPCRNFHGDYLMVRSLKNKLDYARLRGMETFYNMATFTSDLPSWWVKLPLLRSLMLSRPDVEWFWWADSDAVFTDMAFELPLDRYDGYNFVIHGWESLVYGERKWTGLNMGVFLVRNCQWTLDLFDELAPMGVRGDVGDKVGKILTMSLSGRPENFESDDQGAFVYLLNADRERWGSKVYLESSYHLNGYWKLIVDRYEELQANSKPGFGDERWPLITHFTGCQICSGVHNPEYSPDNCRAQMERALAFADNQVLHDLGYKHPELSSLDIVRKS